MKARAGLLVLLIASLCSACGGGNAGGMPAAARDTIVYDGSTALTVGTPPAWCLRSAATQP